MYGRVWTDPKELSPWVVLLDRPRTSPGRRRGAPKIVFRRGGEEWSWPIPGDVRLAELGDELLRDYLERARAG